MHTRMVRVYRKRQSKGEFGWYTNLLKPKQWYEYCPQHESDKIHRCKRIFISTDINT